MTGDRALAGQVVVIVGASSGVGRAAARAFAEAGAHVVVAARRGGLLEEVRAEGEAQGAQALCAVVDAVDAAAVSALAEAAVARFGRIDVWVNNVGVGAVGSFDETPIEAHQQTIRSNLIGHLNGAHAAVAQFKRQGRGVLITTNSIGGWAPAPYAVAYSASKFGLRGYTAALRAELSGQRDIHVCDVYPTFLDTPGIGHAANYVGRRLRPPPMVKDPVAVARTMVRLAVRPRTTTVVGATGVAALAAHALAPRLTTVTLASLLRLYFRVAGRATVTDGAVFLPMTTGSAVHGGWRRPGLRAIGLAAVGGLAILGLAAARRGRST